MRFLLCCFISKSFVSTLLFVVLFSGILLLQGKTGHASTAPYAVVKVKNLNMRGGPGTHHRVIKVLSEGMHLKLTSTRRKGWTKVRYLDGTTGWVSRKYIRKVYHKGRQTPSSPAWKEGDISPLENAVERFIKDKKKRKQMARIDYLSLIVQDLQTGEYLAEINPSKQVKAASLIKVPILQAYMIQRYRKKIKHTKRNQKDLRLMIRFSSNRSTNRILKILGGPRKVAKILKKTGQYENLKLVEYIPKGGKTYLNKISAEDLNRLFVKMWNRQVLGPSFSKVSNRKASEQMLYLLGLSSRRGVRDRLKDGTCFANDRQAKVWDKTGFVRGLNGDVGIIEVSTPQGRKAYSIISIISRYDYNSIRGSGNRWAGKQSKLHRKISEMSYAYFKMKYGKKVSCGRDRLFQHGGSSLLELVADAR